MTSLFFPFSPQLNIVQLYQEECVMVLLLAGNFPVHTASVAPVQNNLMVFMRRSCKHNLKSLHAASINALSAQQSPRDCGYGPQSLLWLNFQEGRKQRTAKRMNSFVPERLGYISALEVLVSPNQLK